MSTEIVEVTAKIPKRILNVLEQENYFGWSKQDFWTAAAQSLISSELTEMDADEREAIIEKHGFDPGLLNFTEIKQLEKALTT
jgi:hypothetical protein